MTVPTSVFDIFGWRGKNPNIADKDSKTSRELASALFERLGVARVSNEKGQTLGRMLESAIQRYLSDQLHHLDASRGWVVGSQKITDFTQYAHLQRISDLLAEADQGGTLRSELGTDYVIEPDVTVGISGSAGVHLHAAVSCKWTIRSDRVQNIRHEGVILTKHRRGRQPHVVTVTAEPMPSRLASIARGTGEVDCVYHVALEELLEVTRGSVQFDTLDELVLQDRLRPVWVLPEVLSLY